MDAAAAPPHTPPRSSGWTAALLREFMERLRDRALTATIAGSLLVTLLNTVQSVLLLRMLQPEGRGAYGSAILYTQLLTFIGVCGVYIAAPRLAVKYADRLDELRRACLRTGLLTGLVTAVVAAAVAFVTFPEAKRFLLPLAAVCTLALPWEHARNNLLGVEQGAENFSRFNGLRLFQAAILPVLLVVAYLAGAMNYRIAALLTIAVPLIALAGHRFVGAAPVFGKSTPSVGGLLRQGAPYGVSVLVNDLFHRCDMLLAFFWTSLAVQGLYQTAYPVAALMLVGPNALGVFALNSGARRQGPVDRGRLARYGMLTVLFQLATGAAFALVLALLLRILFAEQADGIARIAYPLLPAFAASGVAVVADSYLRGLGRVAPGMIVRISAAVAMVPLAWVLNARWIGVDEGVGIAVAASIAHGAAAVVLCWWVMADAAAHNRSLDQGGDA